MSRRAVAVAAAASLTLGGMMISYVVPAVDAVDLRYATTGQVYSGLGAGLIMALLGTSFAMPFVTPRKERRYIRK